MILTQRTRSEEIVRCSRYAVVVVAVAAAALISAGQHASSARAAQHSSATDALTRHYFVYGMTKKQVQHIIGRPKAIRGAYWFYPVAHGKIAGKIAVVAAGTNVVLPADQFRVFFYAGTLQGEAAHVKLPKGYKWVAVSL